ncbi:MAG TPA: hypothetical protein DDZ41_03550 [Flavobacterium sp.]|nr:hypothetical protein [Flavobacterium sp.]
MESITPKMAVKRMRELTDVGLSFSFEFVSYSKKNKESKGKKFVSRAMLRRSYTAKQSSLSNQLIAYIDLDTNNSRQFHLPLLTKFNNYTIKP